MPNNVSITVNEVRANRRRNPNILAEITAEIRFPAHTITIDDARVLNGKKGPWVSLPSHAISDGGRDYTYHPSVVFSADLAKQFEEAVLSAYEAWQKKSNPESKPGSFVNAHGLVVGADDIGF